MNIIHHSKSREPIPINAKVYVFHSDGGHAWFAVKRKELEKLDICNKISSCSYQNGATVYLEEDCDFPLFVNAKDKANEPFSYRETHKDYSPIRGYEQFTP